MLLPVCDFETWNGGKKSKVNKSFHSLASSFVTFIFHIVTECRIYLRECSQFYELSHSTSLWTFQYYRPRLVSSPRGLNAFALNNKNTAVQSTATSCIDSTGIWFKVFRPLTLLFCCGNQVNDGVRTQYFSSRISWWIFAFLNFIFYHSVLKFTNFLQFFQ